jgi:hypothetical protein
MTKVFVSHSSVDKPFVERLATDLRTRESIDAWLDKWEIQPGDSIARKIEEGLDGASVFLFVLSPQSVDAQWVNWERDAWLTAQIEEEKRAKQESRQPGRRLIPVLYQGCKIPPFIGAMLYVSINDQNYEEGFQTLVRGIRGETGKPPLGTAETSSSSVSSSTSSSVPGIAPRIVAFNLLKSLLPAQFDEVIFLYDIDDSQLPRNVAQVQIAKDVMKLASQKEGDSFADLLNTIYGVAPQLKR